MSRISFVLLFDDVGYGVRTLSSILRSHGHETRLVSIRHQEDIFSPPSEPILDSQYGTSLGCSEKEIDLLIEVLKEQQPDWVGVSVASTYAHLAQYISDRVREALSVPVVWGGIDATFNPDIAIRYADIVCLGEADETIVELAEALAGKGSLAAVHGIWYRESGSVRKTPNRRPFTDLDRLPLPDYDLSRYTLIHRDRVVRGTYHPQSLLRIGGWPIMTARGCPYHCSFCCNGVENEAIPFATGMRARSPEHVLREMAWIRENQPHIQGLYVTDEVFGPNTEWLKALAHAMGGKKMFALTVYAHPNSVKPSRLELCRAVGAESIIIGIQSGSERVNREIFNRRTSQEQILRAVNDVVDAGFSLLIELIGSNPFETETDFREAVELLLKLRRPYNLGTIYPLTFWRNYAITDRALKEAIPLRQFNDCTWYAQDSDAYAFRDAFLLFVALSAMRQDTVHTLLEDQTLRRHPDTVVQLNEVLKHYYYYRERSDSYFPKDEYIKQLRSEMEKMKTELHTLRGSRLVRYYFRAKEALLGKMLRR